MLTDIRNSDNFTTLKRIAICTKNSLKFVQSVYRHLGLAGVYLYQKVREGVTADRRGQ